MQTLLTPPVLLATPGPPGDDGGMDLRQPSPAFAAISIFLAASLWGLYWVPIRYMEGLGIDGIWAVALLNLPPVFVLLPFVVRVSGRHALLIGLTTGLALALYASGLVLSTVVRATLLFYLTPVWSTLIGMIWLGERIDWRRWAAIGVGLLGMGLLLSAGSLGPMALNTGDLMGLLSGFFWGVGAVMIRRFGETPLVPMAFWQFVGASGSAMIFATLFGLGALPMADAAVTVLPVAALASLLAILPTLLVIFWMQKFVSPGRVGLLMMSEVMVAVISASLFLPEEWMSPIEWVGAALIVSACLIEVLSGPLQGDVGERA